MQKLGIAASVFDPIGLALITVSVTNLYRTSPSWPVWVDIVSFTIGAILLGDLIVAAIVMLISRKSDSPPPLITLDVALVQTAQQSQTVVVHTEPAGSQDSLIRYSGWGGRNHWETDSWGDKRISTGPHKPSRPAGQLSFRWRRLWQDPPRCRVHPHAGL